jgi:hypothetical protein
MLSLTILTISSVLSGFAIGVAFARYYRRAA